MARAKAYPLNAPEDGGLRDLIAAHDWAATSLGSIESVKAVSELFAPVSGEVVEINETLAEKPELVNTDPYGDGWMMKIQFASQAEVDALLNSTEYEDFLAEQKES